MRSGIASGAAGTGRAVMIAALVLCFCNASTVLACPVPVFQYSLEQWETDPYRLVIHHHGDLDEASAAVVEKLERFARGEGELSKANIVISYRDYSIPENPPEPARALPYIEVRYPGVSRIRRAAMTRPLTEQAVGELMDSPLRRELSSHLLDRKAAVWILLESGDRSKDRDVIELLNSELRRMERTLTVPDPMEEWGVELGDIHTDIDFTMLRLGRDDKQEKALTGMLLGVEPDLHEFEDEPIVFIVYGRGLVLYPLIGRGINAHNINAVGEFITGPCSCEVKSGNPGVDLLMAVDWDETVEQRFSPHRPAATGTSGFLDRQDEADRQFDEDD